MPDPGDPISLILKLPGDHCNINCHYCYEKRKPEQQFQVMQGELVASTLLRFSRRPLSIELHGGEPLVVGKSAMRAVLGAISRHDAPVRVTLQTNGIGLDEDWLDFFMTECPSLEFSTSLDGDPITNAHRVDYSDRPTHQRIESLFALFERRGFRIGCICTVVKAALGQEKRLLDYFLQFPAINLLKLNPCFDHNVVTRDSPGNRSSLNILNPNGQGLPGWAISPSEFQSFLTEFLKHWVETGAYGRLPIEPFMSILRALGGKATNFCVYNEAKCGHVVSLYPDGRLTACDEFTANRAALLSDVTDSTSSLDSPLQFNPTLESQLNHLLDKCTSCSHRLTCRGGCLATRMRYYGSPLYEDYCNYRIGVINAVKELVDGGIVNK